MKILKINREDLLKKNYEKVNIVNEQGKDNTDMDKELGDFLYKLLQYSSNSKDNEIGLVSSRFSFTLPLNMSFVVRNKSKESIIKEVISLYGKAYERIKIFYNVEELNLIILDDNEEFVTAHEKKINDKIMYLKGADVA